jgi:hypothetical protein
MISEIKEKVVWAKGHPVVSLLIFVSLLAAGLFFYGQIKSCQYDKITQETNLEQFQKNRESVERNTENKLSGRTTDNLCIIGENLWE